MADMGVREEDKSTLIFRQIIEKSAECCERCTTLENQLLSAQKELKTARLITDLLLEDVKSSGDVDTKDIRNSADGSQISLKESNWIQIPSNPHKKMTGKLKDHNEVHFKTNNRFEALSNLNEAFKPMEASKAVCNNVDNGANQVSVRIYQHDGNAQTINSIPVIVNGLKTFYNNEVQISDTTLSSDNANAYGNKLSNKQVISKKKIAVLATDISKNKGNHIPRKMEDSNRRGSVETSNNPKQKILIIGDSHVRGLAVNISSNLNYTFDVMGNFKPNATIEAIISSLNKSEEQFLKKDVIIFFGGTKDISKNESKKGLQSLKAFFQRTNNTNVILLRAPLRYDLSPDSCVNLEVNRFNKRLQSLVNNFVHVSLVNVNIERLHHTKHGLHLNNQEKDWISLHLVKEINTMFSVKSTSSPIALPWKDLKLNTVQWAQGTKGKDYEDDCIVINNVMKNNEMGKIERKLVPTRKSCRTKRATSTSQNDFLWSNETRKTLK
jgi:hypothetical protein